MQGVFDMIDEYEERRGLKAASYIVEEKINELAL